MCVCGGCSHSYFGEGSGGEAPRVALLERTEGHGCCWTPDRHLARLEMQFSHP